MQSESHTANELPRNHPRLTPEPPRNDKKTGSLGSFLLIFSLTNYFLFLTNYFLFHASNSGVIPGFADVRLFSGQTTRQNDTNATFIKYTKPISTVLRQILVHFLRCLISAVDDSKITSSKTRGDVQDDDDALRPISAPLVRPWTPKHDHK